MSTNESAKRSDYPIGKIESRAFNAIQLDHFKPILHPQVINYLPGNGSFYCPPPLYQKHSFYKYKYGGTYLIIIILYVLILSGGGCCAGFEVRPSFFAAGVVARRGHPLQPGQFNHPYQSNIKAAHPRYSLAPNNFLTAPTSSSGCPYRLIRYTKTKPHGSLIAPSKTRLISPSAVQMQVKARDSQRDHWDLPNLPDNPGG